MRIGILARQVWATVHYAAVTLPRRSRSALVLIAGMAGITAVYVAIFAIADGIRTALTAGTDDDVAIFVQDGSLFELNSRLSREAVATLSSLPQIARHEERPLASPEVVAVIGQDRLDGIGSASLLLRGVTAAAFEMRGSLDIVRGRTFRFGHDEAIAGISASAVFADLEIGDVLTFGDRDLQIVGLYASRGGHAESEVWTSATVVRDVFALGPTYNSLRVRLRDADLLWDLEGEIISDPRLSVSVKRESSFYREQSQVMTLFVEGFGWFVVALMGGAVGFVTLNTAFGAVAGRRREIGTLRSLGYGRVAIVSGLLAEVGLLTSLGSGLGAVVAYLAFDGLQASTLNLTSLTQLVFSFRVSHQTVVWAIAIATALGIVAGAGPAVSAVRQPPFLATRGA